MRTYGTEPHVDPGDLGRRIRERREQLGLSREQLAGRVGMAQGYLDYLERRPGAHPGVAAIIRLAAALDTTVASLRGGGAERPPGAQARPGGQPVLERLAPAECRRLLRPGGVGRIVVDEARGPVAVPLNYVVDGDQLVVRVGEGAVLAALRVAPRVSFEVDQLDEVLGEGWSVLVSGPPTLEPAPDAAGAGCPLPDPWPGDDRPQVVRIALEQLSGRRIRHHG